MYSRNVKIGVIGAGSWGTALANLLASKGYPVALWVFEENVCQEIMDTKENRTYLPGYRLSDNLIATNDLGRAIRGMSHVLFVTPSHVARKVLGQAGQLIWEHTQIISATKGIEEETLLTNSQVIEATLPPVFTEHAVYLSGPSFAREVAACQPTAVTVASKDDAAAAAAQELFSTPFFRVYRSRDIVGLEVGGSIKNVIAIGAGLSEGLGFGYNARAALITRGLAEMARLGVAMGAEPLTFSGLSGLGDLVLTCTGDLSRNRTVGMRLGKGERLDDILADMKMVAEGIRTAKAAHGLSKKFSVSMPICESIYRILFEGLPPRDAVAALMEREKKEESEFI